MIQLCLYKFSVSSKRNYDNFFATIEKPVKCTALPTGYKKKLLRCNWCKKSVRGNTFKDKHDGGKPGHEYLSYTEVGQTSLDLTKWAKKTKKKEKTQQENIEIESRAKTAAKEARIEQSMNLANDEEKILNVEKSMKLEKGEGNSKPKETKKGLKRTRQMNLLETYGKIPFIEKKLETLVSKIEDPEIENYLNQVQECVLELKLLVLKKS